MKIKYIPILISVVAFTSCNDFLDVKPVGKLIPTEVAQFENLLNNTSTISSHYIDNNGGCGMAFFGDNFSISENQANYSYVVPILILTDMRLISFTNRLKTLTKCRILGKMAYTRLPDYSIMWWTELKIWA